MEEFQNLLPKEPIWTEKKQNKLYFFSKFLFICGAIGMVIISALRFTLVHSSTVHDTIVNAYFLFLGIVTGLSQLGI